MTEQEWRVRFGMRLTNMISGKGCTRREFAEECGVSARALEYYIYGKRTPSVPILLNMARALGYSVEEIADFGENIDR